MKGPAVFYLNLEHRGPSLCVEITKVNLAKALGLCYTKENLLGGNLFMFGRRNHVQGNDEKKTGTDA